FPPLAIPPRVECPGVDALAELDWLAQADNAKLSGLAKVEGELGILHAVISGPVSPELGLANQSIGGGIGLGVAAHIAGGGFHPQRQVILEDCLDTLAKASERGGIRLVDEAAAVRGDADVH